MEGNNKKELTPYLSPAGAYALSLGTSIGWGSMVITCNTYLAQAGPLGSVLGMLVATVIMLVISRSYHYLMNCFPESGGAYAYARDSLGHDHGFLVAWFLALTYFAVLWANATALPLFARYFMGTIFEFGKLYTIFGYDVYVGEALLSIAAIILVSLIISNHKRVAAGLMIGMVGFFALAITVCFLAAMLGHEFSFAPQFVPDQTAVGQILKIAAISPWAFIGFENISHATEEFTFSRSKSFRILIISVVSTTLLYIFLMLLSVSAYPPEYDSWLAYIRDIGNLGGIKGLPAFYAADHYLGSLGVVLLMIALLCLVLTSLIGNILTLSRLFYALAKDEILPGRYAHLNRHSAPGKAIGLIALISVFVPFVGRTAIGWIVDVTTLGAVLTYGFVSACAVKMADIRSDKAEKPAGVIGLAVMVFFGLYLLLPNLFTTGSIATESLFLFVVWSVLGFIYFRIILSRDKAKRFGQSIIVWIALLSLILFVSLVWMSNSMVDATSSALNEAQNYYTDAGMPDSSGIIAHELSVIRHTNARSVIVVVLIFAMSLGMLLNNYQLMSRRAIESEMKLGMFRDIANKDPLTGVKSKHAFMDMEQTVDEELAKNPDKAFAIAVCDVNGLKFINDTLGHKAGDEYIRSASTMICEIFQHSPVYRMGGDEFVVYMTGRDYENRKALVQAVHDKSVEHISTGEVVVSCGFSDYQPGTDTVIHSVFERADNLMYQEKQLLKSMGAATRL